MLPTSNFTCFQADFDDLLDEGDGDDGLAAGEVGPGGEVCDNPDLCSQLLTFTCFQADFDDLLDEGDGDDGLGAEVLDNLYLCSQLLTSLFPG